MDLTRQDQGRLLDCLLEMGDLLLDCGAEIGRVEDTLSRMGHAYGAEQMNVFVIPSLISVSMSFPDTEAITETRRIHSFGNTDFYRLEKINAMSRECSTAPIPLDELRARLDKVAHGRKPFSMVFWGSVLGGGGFAVFFGGDLWDGLVAAAFAALICLLQRRLSQTQLGVVASNLMVSLVIGLGVGLVAELIPALHMDKILIGDIMLLIPGLAFCNSIHDMVMGDTISGVLSMFDAVLRALSIAIGYVAVWALMGRFL